jgi:hypothetical protein
MASASPFTESVYRSGLSARVLHARRPIIFGMDVISIVLGVLMFAVLIALVYGIERI